ncbi:MAG: hypothetical protein IJT32_07325 [Lachnospiraceae bacterium]|nr:hypothetical protein [Lachnospiraceae bacterium]
MKRFFIGKLSVKKQQRIVIAGTQRGVGVTHFALALANVAAARERRSTLYMEVGQQGNIVSLRTKDTFAIDGLIGFRREGVAFLPHVPTEDACAVFSDPRWDVIICDVTENDRTEVLVAASTSCLLLADVKPWHYTVFQQSMKEWMWERNKKRASLLSLHMRKQDEKRCRREFGTSIEALPFIADPFSMTYDEAAQAARFL